MAQACQPHRCMLISIHSSFSPFSYLHLKYIQRKSAFVQDDGFWNDVKWLVRPYASTHNSVNYTAANWYDINWYSIADFHLYRLCMHRYQLMTPATGGGPCVTSAVCETTSLELAPNITEDFQKMYSDWEQHLGSLQVNTHVHSNRVIVLRFVSEGKLIPASRWFEAFETQMCANVKVKVIHIYTDLNHAVVIQGWNFLLTALMLP